jgi:heme exporter protein D
MSALESFFHMGGYAAYVWPAVGLTLAVLLGFVAVSLRRLKRTRRQLDALEATRLRQPKSLP